MTSAPLDSTPGISCVARFGALASGSGAVRWGSATVNYFFGRERTAPLDQIEVPAAEVQGWWSGETLQAGQHAEASLQFYASAPFGATMDFRYTADGSDEERVTSVQFTCGPTVPPGTPRPSITQLTVEPATGEVEPGDVVRVAYRVEASAPLWTTFVQLTGACDERRYFPTLGTSANVERTVEITVPVACAGATPLSVRVHAMDVGLGEASRTGTTLAVVDRSPPRMTGMSFQSFTGDWSTGGDFFAGDSLRIRFGAEDNQGIATIVWEVLPYGQRDSMRVDAYEAFGHPLTIPLQPEWEGALQLRLFVRDPSGLTSDTITSAPDSLRVHPTVARPMTSWQGDAWISEAMWDETRDRLYLLEASPNRIRVLEASTFEVLQSIPLPEQPMDFDRTPGGDTLVVLVWYSQSLGVIALDQPTPVIAWRPVPGAHALTKVHAIGAGRAFVAANFQEAPSWRLFDVTLATGEMRARTEVDDMVLNALQFGRTADYGVHVLNGYRTQRFDAATDTFGPVTDGGMLNAVPSLDATAQRIAMGLALYDGSLQPLRTAPDRGQHPPTVISPDGATLHHVFAAPYDLVQVRAADGSIVDRTVLPAGSLALQVSRDGTRLLVVRQNGLSFVQLR